MDKKLTPKQQKFVEEYLVDLNASAAARRAGYSPKTANRQAAETLTKPVIQEAIAKRQEALRKNTDITPERVAKEFARLGFEEEEISVKDKLKALELLAKHLGMFTEKHEVSGPGGGPVMIEFVEPEE